MAEFNEENKEVDPYESLAAAMSGNTETAVNASESEDEKSEPEEGVTSETENITNKSSDTPSKEKKQMAKGNGDSLESAFRIHRMFESIRDSKLAQGDKEEAESYNNIIKNVDIAMAGYEGISSSEYETRRQAFEESLKSENNQDNQANDNSSNIANNLAQTNQDDSGIEGGFSSIRSLEAIRDNYLKEGLTEKAQHFDNIVKSVEIGMAAYHGMELQDYQQRKQDFYKQTELSKTNTAESKQTTENQASAQPAPEQAQQPTQPQPAKAQEQQRELHPTNVGQAQAWFKVEGVVDKLDTHDLASLQLSQKENPNSFTDAQRQQVKDLAWQKIQNVANHNDKLEPKDLKGFESLLKNVPADKRMETSKDLDTVKSAETRLYRAKNGIEDKSLGEKTKEGFSKAKLNTSKALKQSKIGLKKAFNAGLNKLDKSVNKLDNAIDSGLNKIDDGVDKMVAKFNKFGKSVSAYAYKKKAQTLGFIKNNKLVRGTKKAYKKTVNFGKKVYNFGKKTVKAVQTGYKKTKKFAKSTKNFFKRDLTDKEKAVKLAGGKLDKLTSEQIAFAYNTLKDIDQKRNPHSKEVNALYSIKGFADRKMDSISADKSILTAGNAKQAAEWLNISQHVQDTVNHNRVEAKNNRNNDVALALQSYGLDTKMVTATEKQETANKTDVNSDSQEQVVKQEMTNSSSDKIITDSETFSAALSGNTETAANLAGDDKTSTPSDKPQAPVNTAKAPNPQDIAAKDKKILEQLSGRSNLSVPTQSLNPDKNITLDKAPEAKLPENTFTATPEMFKEPKTDNKPAPAPEAKTAEANGNKTPKKKLTKEQKIARKLFAKTGRGKNTSRGSKNSPTIVRALDPKLKAAMKNGRQSA